MKKFLIVLLPISLFVFSCSTISHYPLSTRPHIPLDKSEVDVKNDVIKETNLKYIIGPFTFGEFDNVTEKVLFQNPEYHYLVHPIIETTTTNYLIFREVSEEVTTKVGKLKDRNTFYYQNIIKKEEEREKSKKIREEKRREKREERIKERNKGKKKERVREW